MSLPASAKLTFWRLLLPVEDSVETATEVVTTIRQGVPAKGMVPWGGILTPEQINQVAAYVLQKHMDATGRQLEDVMAEPGAVEGQ